MALLVTLAAAVTAAGALASSSSPDAVRIIVHRSPYGKILFDGRGFTLYAFTRDGRGRSKCSGACAKAWPPYVVKKRPLAGAGVPAALIGTVKRSDGSLQVTFDGRPLYYYAGDRNPGQILCQDVAEFGGTWLVLRANGRLVR